MMHGQKNIKLHFCRLLWEDTVAITTLCCQFRKDRGHVLKKKLIDLHRNINGRYAVNEI